MKMNFFVLLSLLGLAACTTNSVKMSPEETQSFFAVNTELAEARDDGMKVRAQYCDNNTGPCWKIECTGENCWKTALETPPEELVKKPTENPEVSRSKCESKTESAAVRRTSCYNYVSYLSERSSVARINESLRILKTMCDFNGVACKLNYGKFGSGVLKTGDSRAHIKSGQLKIYTYARTKTVDIYDYTILEEEI
ncbi:MAG: hypothetical protein JSU04_04710 [Bdellovibrionales bacterium]|nr:hypothetical protein [Bdellovibrionales bacterium]